MQKITSKLFQPIDGAAIAVFRIGFGLILFLDIIRYGWKFSPVYSYLEPDILFKYYGFGWVQPWGGDGLIWHHVVLAICAAGICLGLFYRFCIVVFTLGFTYLFLLDQAQYLNHFYMVILFCCLLCVIPAHRTWSLDTLRKPKMASSILPLWCKVLLVGQLEIILLYAGFVKLNADWLNLEPLRMWLASSADLPLLGEYFVQDWSIAVGEPKPRRARDRAHSLRRQLSGRRRGRAPRPAARRRPGGSHGPPTTRSLSPSSQDKPPHAPGPSRGH